MYLSGGNIYDLTNALLHFAIAAQWLPHENAEKHNLGEKTCF